MATPRKKSNAPTRKKSAKNYVVENVRIGLRWYQDAVV